MSAKIYKSFVTLNGYFFSKTQVDFNIKRELERYSLPLDASGFIEFIGDRCVNRPTLEQLEAFFDKNKIDLSQEVDFSKEFPDFWFNTSREPIQDVILSANPAYADSWAYLGTVAELEAAGVEMPCSCIFLANGLTPEQQHWLAQYSNNEEYDWCIIYL